MDQHRQTIVLLDAKTQLDNVARRARRMEKITPAPAILEDQRLYCLNIKFFCDKLNEYLNTIHVMLYRVRLNQSAALTLPRWAREDPSKGGPGKSSSTSGPPGTSTVENSQQNQRRSRPPSRSQTPATVDEHRTNTSRPTSTTLNATWHYVPVTEEAGATNGKLEELVPGESRRQTPTLDTPRSNRGPLPSVRQNMVGPTRPSRSPHLGIRDSPRRMAPLTSPPPGGEPLDYLLPECHGYGGGILRGYTPTNSEMGDHAVQTGGNR